jgi:hypothetical protein
LTSLHQHLQYTSSKMLMECKKMRATSIFDDKNFSCTFFLSLQFNCNSSKRWCWVSFPSFSVGVFI